MFKSAQDYITLIISRDFVHAGLVNISPKSAEVKSFADALLEEGIIEDGVVYNPQGLEASIKSAISQLHVKGKPKISLVIPDNKVIVMNSHSIDKLEKKHDATFDELSIIKSDTGIVAIKKETLHSYINVIENLGYDVYSIFPMAMCLQNALKNYIVGDTIVLYPFEVNKLKFFIINDKGVVLNSVMGHNILDKDTDLEKGLKEIETYAITQEISEGISKVLSISNGEDDVSSLITAYKFEYVEKDQEEIDNLPFLVIKGMIKNLNSMQKGFNAIDVDFIKPQKNKSVGFVPSSNPKHSRNALKLGIIATILTLLVFGLIGVLILALVNARKQNEASTTPTIIPTAIYQTSTTPSLSPIPSPTSIAVIPTPTPAQPSLSQYSVQILNGNGIVGDSEKVRQVLLAKGFQNISKANAANFNYTTTSIYFKAGANQAAQSINDSISGAYRKVVMAPAPAGQSSDIVMILGAK